MLRENKENNAALSSRRAPRAGIRREENDVEKSWRKGIAFLVASTGLVLVADAMHVLSATAQEKRPTAQEVIAAIQEHVGVPWKTDTVDTFKAGNPETRVTGIAVTMMATLDVLQRAAAKGQNLIITH